MNSTYAINLNAVAPVRATPSEKSEMVTQLLFGEACSISDTEAGFVQITNLADGYSGWIDRKMLTEMSEQTAEKFLSAPLFMTCVALAQVFCMTDKTIYHLSAGSRLPFYEPQTSSFKIGERLFQIHPDFVTYLPQPNKENVVASAMLFLNAPYLWGGKSLFGIDCSGLVQTVYAMNGSQLPRDASAQVNEGQPVSSLEEAIATDLLFFEKEGQIVHTGIYLGNEKIIHASGRVKIELVDQKGIINTDTNEYSHYLHRICRI